MQIYAQMENGEMKFYDNNRQEVIMNMTGQFNPMQTQVPIAPIPVPMVSPRILFSDFIPEYLLMQKYQVRQNTYEIYKITAETHIIPYFKKLNIAIQEITTLHIQHYMHVKQDEGLSPSTLKKHFTIINGALSYAMYNLHMILYNPADRVRRAPAHKRKFTYLNDTQIKLLFAEIKGHPLEAAIILASHYGLRRSEVLGLRWSAICFTSNTITIKRTVVRTNQSTIDIEMTKSSESYRTMPLMKGVKQYLQQLYIKQKNQKLKNKDSYVENDFVCKKEDGTPIRPDNLTKGFSTIMKNSTLPYIRFHDLRHSAASLMINGGYDLLDISHWLGHNDLNATKRYAHLEYWSKEELADFMDKQLELGIIYDLDEEDNEDEFNNLQGGLCLV